MLSYESKFSRQNPYPIIVFSVANIVDPILVTLVEICNFCDPKLVTFYLCIYLINPLNRSSRNELTYFLNKLNEEHFTFRLQYKYPDRFANRKYEQLSYPKNPKMCDPILVTLLKMQPH